MPSPVIHAFYRGEPAYIVPTVCAMQDMADDLFTTRWQGIFPGMIPSIYNITVHEDDGNALGQSCCNVSYMVSDPTDFEPATKRNLGQDNRLNLLFEVLNTLGIHLISLRPEHILVRQYLAHSPFTYTPRPSNAPPEAVPYHKNVVLLAGWHRASQRMNNAQLAETREIFRDSLPDETPPALEPSTKQLDGFWYCQEYHRSTGKVCNTAFYYAANMREHLVELHEVPREKLDKEVEAVRLIGSGKENNDGGFSRVSNEVLGRDKASSKDKSGRASVAGRTEEDILASDDEEHEALVRSKPEIRWAGDEVMEEHPEGREDN